MLQIMLKENNEAIVTQPMTERGSGRPFSSGRTGHTASFKTTLGDGNIYQVCVNAVKIDTSLKGKKVKR